MKRSNCTIVCVYSGVCTRACVLGLTLRYSLLYLIVAVAFTVVFSVEQLRPGVLPPGRVGRRDVDASVGGVCDWVVERYPLAVQRDLREGVRFRRQNTRIVNVVARYRVVDGGELCPDLVLAAGVQIDCEEGVFGRDEKRCECKGAEFGVVLEGIGGCC